MKRTLLALVVLVTVGALLIPSGAVTFDDTDRPHAALALSPHDGQNGGYALVNSDDELELLLTNSNPRVDGEGISSDAVTPIARVFTVTNTGERPTTVWLTDGSDDVRFFRGDDPSNSVENRENATSLAPSTTAAVGLVIDTTDPDHDVADAESFTVHASRDGASDPGDDSDSRPNSDDSTGESGVESISTTDPPAATRDETPTPTSVPATESSPSPVSRRDSPTSTPAGVAGGQGGTAEEPVTLAGSLGILAILVALLAALSYRYLDSDEPL